MDIGGRRGDGREEKKHNINGLPTVSSAVFEEAVTPGMIFREARMILFDISSRRALRSSHAGG